MEEHTDLYTLGRPYTGRVSPGFLLVHHNAQLHVVRIQNSSGTLWEVKPAVAFLGAYTSVVRHTYKHPKAMKKLVATKHLTSLTQILLL